MHPGHHGIGLQRLNDEREGTALSFEVRRGLYLHLTYVVTLSGSRSGASNAWTWARELKKGDTPRGGILES